MMFTNTELEELAGKVSNVVESLKLKRSALYQEEELLKEKIKMLESERTDIQVLINILEGSDNTIKEAGKYITSF